MDSTHNSELVFLGTGGACGSPTFYCGCPACEEALANPAEAKTCSSIAVLGSQTTLIDTAPEIRLQLTRERIGHVDRVLFTHEHFDHAGGFGQLEYPMLVGRASSLPVYGTKRCLSWLESHFEWMWDKVVPHEIEPFQQLDFDGVSYTALPASHCPDALGYLIETGQSKVAYFPDTGPLSAEVLERLQGLSALIHDSTFIGRNWTPSMHTTPEGTIELGRSLGAQSVYLTHCTMHFDMPRTAADMREEFARLSEDGMQIVLPHDGDRIPLD